MKIAFLSILLLLVIDFELLAQRPVLTKEDYRKFIGRPVYEFLLNDSFRDYTELYILQEPPSVLHSLSVYFGKKYYISLQITYQFVEQFNIQSDWDKNSLYKEKILKIEIVENEKVTLSVKNE